MIDKRDGFTRKPEPTQEPYFPQSHNPPLPNKSNQQPSQKKAPGTVKPE